MTQSPAKATLGQLRTELSGSQKGDIAEMYVMLIAQWKGAKVHRNVSCVGNTDIVLQIEDEYYPIDVKLAQNGKNRNGSSSWRATQASEVKLPVYPVIVEPQGDIMAWKIRWKATYNSPHAPPHCPPGLENFWSKPSTNV